MPSGFASEQEQGCGQSRSGTNADCKTLSGEVMRRYLLSTPQPSTFRAPNATELVGTGRIGLTCAVFHDDKSLPSVHGKHASPEDRKRVEDSHHEGMVDSTADRPRRWSVPLSASTPGQPSTAPRNFSQLMRRRRRRLQRLDYCSRKTLRGRPRICRASKARAAGSLTECPLARANVSWPSCRDRGEMAKRLPIVETRGFFI